MKIARQPPLACENDQVHIGIKTFFVKPQVTLVPNVSQKRVMSPENHVVGRFQSLKSLNHPSLCQYIEIINGNYENRVFVVSEHYAKNLRMELRESISAGQKYYSCFYCGPLDLPFFSVQLLSFYWS
eukprot:TRINITY_DN6854_c0_g1_i25.p1 TRINITY_DN6854_c0_g1~~TRINITY_DN6854_c0_g1_i25.p1  ORF type:complete len:127 (+),score=12.22 TRINITY_DN6854_c0_g1_i25:70-450(+)